MGVVGEVKGEQLYLQTSKASPHTGISGAPPAPCRIQKALVFSDETFGTKSLGILYPTARPAHVHLCQAVIA